MRFLSALKRNWLFVCLAFAFLLRLPSLFGVYSYGDECIYLTLGQAAREGLTWYRNIHDNKPPILYLIAMISGNLFWFRAILLVWGLATISLFFQLIKILFPNQEKVIKIITFAFAVLSSLPILEGQTANAEVFMVIFTLAGILRLISGNYSKRSAFITGILFSFGTLLKVPAITDFAAVIVFLLFFLPSNKGQLKKEIVRIFFLGIGFLFPIIIFFVWYWLQGAFREYLIAAYLQNFGYLSTWKGSNTGLYLKTAVLAVAFLFIWFFRKRNSSSYSLIQLMFVFSLYGATLSDRPYPHYLFQVLPSFCLLIGLLLTKIRRFEKTVVCFFLIFVSLFYYLYFWHYPLLSYYDNFLRFSFGQNSKEEYQKNLGAGDNYVLAEFIINHTLKNDRIFIWGESSPCLYALSRRLPVGRYAAAYHIVDFNGFAETVASINRVKPRFIINLNTEKAVFPSLTSILQQQYYLYQRIGKTEIYLLKASK